jgi:hypothetical protein
MIVTGPDCAGSGFARSDSVGLDCAGPDRTCIRMLCLTSQLPGREEHTTYFVYSRVRRRCSFSRDTPQ